MDGYQWALTVAGTTNVTSADGGSEGGPEFPRASGRANAHGEVTGSDTCADLFEKSSTRPRADMSERNYSGHMV